MQTLKQSRTIDPQPPNDFPFFQPTTPTLNSSPLLHSSSIQFSQQQIIEIMDNLSLKNSRLMTYFANNKQILLQFKKKHMYQNPYVKIGIRKILYDLSNERKIGKGLKGLSKLLISEIERNIWPILELEIKIFIKNQEIKKYIDVLAKDPEQIFCY